MKVSTPISCGNTTAIQIPAVFPQNVLWLRFSMFVVLLLGAVYNSSAQFPIAAPATNYTQDFNALTNGAWADNTTLTGWYARTDLTASIAAYGANTGSTTTAGLYAFGVAGTNPVTERALGFAPSNAFTGASGTGKGYLGWRLVNNTGATITSLQVTWTGEQWRKDNTATHSLVLSYQQAATVTAVTGGTWIAAGSTFASPIITTGALALDGNAPANRVAGITVNITVTIPAGEEVMLRWEDLNDSGTDHFLAVDDITINATGVSAPAVTTDASPSVITTTTATLGGNVTNDGGSAITARGVVYSETATNSTPTIGGSGVIDAGTAGTTGTFSVNAGPLSVNTQYSYRAYATNSIGTTYGGVSGTTFYTFANTPNAPVVNGATASSLDVAIGAGDGNPAATEYAIQETGSSNYVQAGGALGASPVWQTAATWATVTVTGLAPSTLYNFQVKARNGANVETAFGASAGGTTGAASTPTLNATALAGFGNACINSTTAANTFTITGSALTTDPVTVTALSGYSYSTDDNTYTASLSITQPGGAFSQLVYVQFSPTAVQPYDGNIAIGGGGASGINVAVTGSGINTAPSVTTGGSSSVTQVSATLNGTIPSEGCSPVTAYGIEYSTLNNFPDGTGTPEPGSNLSAGAFSVNVSGLAANTTYYYKAFATSTGGTSYGTQQSFTTTGLDAPNATAATNVTGDSFDANWDAVTGATSYRLDVSTSPTFGTPILATDLFISEYVEGSSSNKYIEIYNGTGASVDLSDYRLRLYSNGATTATGANDVLLSGTLANGSSIVYRNSAATVYLGATTTNSAVNYNGDDAVALFKISTGLNVDIFGRIGEDPGSAWTAPGYTTIDRTLVRKASVTGGVTTNPGAGFPTLATEWDVFLIDDVTHLGAHTFNSFTASFVPGYEDLTVNGTTQAVTGLTPDTYYYRVRAFSASSTSANSNTIEVELECDASVMATAGPGGQLSPAGTTIYTCGENPTYNIAADPCYTIVDVLVDDVSQGPITSYTFTNITTAHTISATFAGITYTIGSSSNGGGTISPDGSSIVNCGNDATYTISPDACFSVGDVLVDGVSVGAVSTYTFNDVDADHTIEAVFIPTPYTILVTAGLHGSVLPGSGTVDCGSSATYTITAEDCYSIEDVLVDGVSVGAVGSYTFFNVTEDHTISASFVINTFTITASSGPNGSVTPAAASTVDCGSDNTYTITPDACYHVEDVLVDGVSAGPVTTYTFTNTTDNHTISATFAINASLAAPVVTGPVNVCPYIGTAEQIVYTANSAGAASYSWVLPPNVVLQGSTTNSITVTFSNGFASQANKQIRVTALSPCGNSPMTIYYLAAQAPVTPSPITGNTSVCSVIGTAATLTYSVPPVAGAASYVWTAQAGTTTISFPNGGGVNGNTVAVSFTNAFTTSPITVQAVNGCGTGTSSARSLTLVKANPSTPSLITGPTNVCEHIAPGGTAAAYSVTSVAGNTYNWTVPAGVSNLTGQGTAAISFTYPAGYTGGSISVVASNGCGNSAQRSLSVSKLNPSSPSPIDVIQSQICPDRVYNYTIAGIPANATSVQWTVPASATSFTGQGTASISVSYPATAVTGTVTAQAINNCGSSVVRSVNVSLAACEDGPPPPPPPGPKAAPVSKVPVATMEVSVFPNPTVSDFKLRVITAGKELIHVRISDMQGRSLKQFTVSPYQTVNVGTDLMTGTYIMEVRQGNEVTTTKLLKF